MNDADYKPPFPLTAKLNKLTIKVGRPQLTEADIKKIENAEATAVDHYLSCGDRFAGRRRAENPEVSADALTWRRR